ncbi:TetR family transcriptional regulator [Telmatospirillum sp.]|uniref:TetR family transcriptional regulator n=1 Tax=Telmatospirillum sp. TaxID=2079197 RepID=UPI00283CB251|nr:TetR family transcriptional regulator [Telmatospirillum sp.]MDR3440161.1 TetR family transcriptional regulator [Telmatospirillum sp.]
MRRTKEEAAETRRIILKSAEYLFMEKSYETVSLEEIAVTAGVTRGAVHWHFHNKQGLLFAIREEMRRPLQELAEQLAADKTDAPLDALTALGDVTSSTFSQMQAAPRQRSLLKILLQLDFAASDDEADGGSVFQLQLRTSLIKIFSSIDRNGGLPSPWTPDSAALTFCAVLNGLVNEWARGKDDFDLVPDAEKIVRALLSGWRAPSHK